MPTIVSTSGVCLLCMLLTAARAAQADVTAEIDSLKACHEVLTREASRLGGTIDSLRSLQSDFAQRAAGIQHQMDSLKVLLVGPAEKGAEPRVIRARLVASSYLRPRPDIMAPESTVRVPKGVEVQVVGYTKGFFWVIYEGNKGYLSHYMLPKTDCLDSLVAAASANSDKYRRATVVSATPAELRKVRIEQRYGKATAGRILRGGIWIGMTEEMASESRGRPTSVNRTVTAFGTIEQWVYERDDWPYLFLYFDNGILTSWQEDR